MDRRNFLAFIPAISAIPFIGKNIEKTESGIFITKPEPITTNAAWIPSDINPMRLQVRLYHDEQQVGQAYITAFHFWNESIDTTCRDSGGARTTIPGLNRAKFECELMHWL